MSQFFMALFGLSAMALALSPRPTCRAWAPMVGLYGQPAWAYFAYETHALGLGVLVAAYTTVYIRAICASGMIR